MGIFVLAVLTGLLVLSLLVCRLMPFEIGSRIVPKSWARFFYASPSPRNK
jgi:hypothetical protein